MKLFDRILHVVIALENCAILYDIFFRHATVSWWKVGFLSGSVLLLVAVWFFQPKILATHTLSTTQGIPVSDLLNKQAREFATQTLNDLFIRGQYLSSNKPQKDDSANFSRFWNEEVNHWMTAVGVLLEKYWTQQDKQFFLSLVGESPIRFGIGVHDGSAALYNDMLRYLKNLDTLRQQISHRS